MCLLFLSLARSLSPPITLFLSPQRRELSMPAKSLLELTHTHTLYHTLSLLSSSILSAQRMLISAKSPFLSISFSRFSLCQPPTLPLSASYLVSTENADVCSISIALSLSLSQIHLHTDSLSTLATQRILMPAKSSFLSLFFFAPLSHTLSTLSAQK